MTEVERIKEQIAHLKRRVVLARQVRPGAGSDERRIAAAIVADLEASVADWTRDLRRAEAVAANA